MKILITRTAPFKTFENALNRIQTDFPGASLHVLIQKSDIDSLSMYGDDLTPHVVKDGPFNIWGEGLDLLKELKRNRFDMVVILYANPMGRGYSNIELLSFLCGCKKEMVFDIAGNFYPLPSRIKKIVGKIVYPLAGRLLYGFMKLVIFFWEKFLKTDFKKTETAKLSKKTKYPVESGNVRPDAIDETSGKKKIVFVDLMFTWPPHGGACVDLKEVACRLTERGYKVDLIVPKFPGFFPRGDVDESMLPFKVHKIDFSSWTFNFLFLPRKIKERVDRLKPDYVYLGDSYFLKPYLIEALKKYRIIARFYSHELLCPNFYLLYRDNKKCDIHYLSHPVNCLKCALKGMSLHIKSLNGEVWSHEFIASLAFLPSFHKRTIRSLSLCDTLITYNDMVKKLLSPFHNKVISFPGGVNTSAFLPGGGSSNGVKKILVSGRLMDWRKGLNFFLETARRLRNQRDDFEIFLTLDKKYKEEYITSVGWVDHRKINDVYKEVDFCVVPSLWEEPFGMVAVEAMAAGKPVVASSVAGLKMSVKHGETGFLFPPGDSGQLMKYLNKLLDDPELIKKMGEAGRNRAIHCFDWDRVVDKYCSEIFDKGQKYVLPE